MTKLHKIQVSKLTRCPRCHKPNMRAVSVGKSFIGKYCYSCCRYMDGYKEQKGR